MLLNSPQAELGWQAPDFNLPAPNGTHHCLSQLMGKNGLVIAFICNHCPYVKAIIDQLVADAKTLQSEGFGVVAIMSNDFQHYVDDRPDMMQQFADQHEFSFPYLVDEDQAIATAYGAVCTPEFFGFDAQQTLQYRGRLDNTGMSAATPRQAELLQAMRVVKKNGVGPNEQHASMGCSIKWRH